MELIPIKTRIIQPPQDDLFTVLDESLPVIGEKNVILISSKVVAIHEGETVLIEGVDKQELVKKAADLIIPRPYWATPLTVAHNTFLGSAGIDESNGNGHYILLPKNIFVSAKNIYDYLKNKFSLNELGVIIVDSHSSPFRFGATGVALGWWGVEPLEDCRGRKDLFGRAILYERSNLVDGLAAGATVLMGEVDECTPVVIAKDIPRLKFVDANTREQLLVSFEEDTFRVLYDKYL